MNPSGCKHSWKPMHLAQERGGYYDVVMRETRWRQLDRRGRSKIRASNR